MDDFEGQTFQCRLTARIAQHHAHPATAADQQPGNMTADEAAGPRNECEFIGAYGWVASTSKRVSLLLAILQVTPCFT